MKYIKSVIEEMRRVIWPGGDELQRDVVTVVFISLAFGGLITIFDNGLDSFIQFLVNLH